MRPRETRETQGTRLTIVITLLGTMGGLVTAFQTGITTYTAARPNDG